VFASEDGVIIFINLSYFINGALVVASREAVEVAVAAATVAIVEVSGSSSSNSKAQRWFDLFLTFSDLFESKAQ
jgi:hypothetical protein